MSKIDERTLVPIGVLVVLAGGIFWLSTLYVNTEANASAIADLKVDGKDQRREIIERLNIMDMKIDRILRRR